MGSGRGVASPSVPLPTVVIMVGEPTTALVAASFLHLGFQVVVTVLIYPGFPEVPIADWPRAHAAHGRRITPLVALVYGGLVVSMALVVVAGPTPPEWVAIAAAGVAMAVTAGIAAPSHGRLSPDRPDAVLRRLRLADRVRVVAAAIGATASLVAALAR